MLTIKPNADEMAQKTKNVYVVGNSLHEDVYYSPILYTVHKIKMKIIKNEIILF